MLKRFLFLIEETKGDTREVNPSRLDLKIGKILSVKKVINCL